MLTEALAYKLLIKDEKVLKPKGNEFDLKY
jgi:hypothetical protein